MEHKIWPEIHKVFMEVKAASEKCASMEHDEGVEYGYKDLLDLRSRLRTLLLLLKKVLSKNMVERDAYFVLFPIVVYIDERVQVDFFNVRERSWALLQQEFFDVEDGGELFYDTLETVLKNDATPTIVYEVFMLCLADGFRGLYNDNPNKIEAYIEILRNKIPTNSPSMQVEDDDDETVVDVVGISPKWYYLSTAIAAILIYIGAVIFLDYKIPGLGG